MVSIGNRVNNKPPSLTMKNNLHKPEPYGHIGLSEKCVWPQTLARLKEQLWWTSWTSRFPGILSSDLVVSTVSGITTQLGSLSFVGMDIQNKWIPKPAYHPLISMIIPWLSLWNNWINMDLHMEVQSPGVINRCWSHETESSQNLRTNHQRVNSGIHRYKAIHRFYCR